MGEAIVAINTIKKLEADLKSALSLNAKYLEDIGRVATELTAKTGYGDKWKAKALDARAERDAAKQDAERLRAALEEINSAKGSYAGVTCRVIARAALSHQTERAPSALDAVIAERARQDAKWGQQDHEPPLWLGILMEEVGELAQAVNETVFDNGEIERAKGGYANMRAEAVQVAAVAVALVEALDRRYGGDEAHYLIIGKYIGEPMGCCSEEGKADVLLEEPGSTFKLVNKHECPICNES